MAKVNFEVLTNKLEKDISKENLNELRQGFSALSDEKLNSLEAVKVKSSLVTVILSAILGLFGAGSFYLGKIKIGIVKIGFNIILPLAIGLIFLYWIAPMYKDYSVQSNAVYAAVTESRSCDYSLTDFKYVIDNYSEANKNYAEELSKDKPDDKKVSEYYALLEKQKDMFVSYKIRIRRLEENILTQGISGKVEETISFKTVFPSVCNYINNVETSADLTALREDMVKALSELTELQSRALSAYRNFRFDYNFISMFFTVVLAIDGIIIAAYWVGEVFRERDLCYEINYEKIKEALK